MLSSVRLTNDYGGRVDMQVGYSPGASGYRIKDIQGLGPPDSDIIYSDYALIDGGVFHGSKSQPRNLVLTISFENLMGEGIQNLRRDLYKLALPKKKVRLDFFNFGLQEHWIEGYVESHEPDIFSREPQVQISILCVEPFFKSRSMVDFTNLSEDVLTFDYDGDVETGCQIFIEFKQTVEWVDVWYLSYEPNLRVRVRAGDSGFSSGRTLLVQTWPGRKSVTLRSTSDLSLIRNAIGEVSAPDGWGLIGLGSNRMRLRSSNGSAGFVGRVRFNTLYGGL